MPNKFTIIVKATEPPEGDLTGPGDDESPVIDAIKKALSQLDNSLDAAEHWPGPEAFPPTYMVAATASADISEASFKDSLENVWSETTDKEGVAVPQAIIYVETIE